MRSFAAAWPDSEVVQATLAQITWWHNLALLEKVDHAEQRLWYARKTVENGWSRNALVIHIERQLFEAQGGATTNFATTLPAPQSDLARETIKDPYKLAFLGIAEDALRETTQPMAVSQYELTKALPENLKDTLPSVADLEAVLGEASWREQDEHPADDDAP